MSSAGGGSRAPVRLVQLPVGVLRPCLHQLRRRCPQTSLEGLAQSIREIGLLEAIVVRPVGQFYEIIAGERRWRAAQLAGLATVPCGVFAVSEDEAFVMALVENLQRRDLSALDEALAYQEMLDRGIARNRATIAQLLGVSRPRITQRMKLLELDDGTQRRMQEHQEILTEYHGRLLWDVRDLGARHRFADEAVEMRWSGRQLKAQIDNYHRQREIEEWTVRQTGLPRWYEVSLPGFSLRIDYSRANLMHAVDVMNRTVRQLMLLTMVSRS